MRAIVMTEHPAEASPGTQSFEDFYRTSYVDAARLAYLLSGSAATAEDLAQEAFLRIRPKFASLDNPSAYLRVVVVNAVRSWQRSERRRLLASHRLTPPEPSLEPPSEVVDALRRLPYRSRATLVLRYWGGLSEYEIAQTLGVRPGTVKSLAARGLRRMREELSPDDSPV